MLLSEKIIYNSVQRVAQTSVSKRGLVFHIYIDLDIL